MSEPIMSTERVFELIEAYGAEPNSWPEDEREAAKALLAAQPDTFAAVLSDAYALDHWLEAQAVPEPSETLAQAILAQAPVEQPRRKLLDSVSGMIFPHGVRWPAGAALASLVMGVFGGYAYASSGIGYDQADAAYYAVFGVEDSNDWLVSE